MFDAVIIGLGPAGSTLARLLAGKYNVLCLDKKVAEGGFEKPCGGLLAPDAQKILARFDLTLPKSVLVDPQLFAVRTQDLSSGLTRYYQRFYVNMNRAKFDRWLISLIPASVPVYAGAKVIKITRDESGFFTVLFERNGKRKTVQARRVIGADGAASVVRRTFFPNIKSVRTRLFSSGLKKRTKACFIPACLTRTSPIVTLGRFPKTVILFLAAHTRCKTAARGFKFGEPVKTEACLVLRPAGWNEFCTGEEGVFLIGEAAGFINASSLEGISSALKSALALAESLGEKPSKQEHRRYARKTFWLRGKLFLKLFKCPFMYWPRLRRLVMKSGIASISIISAK